MNHTKNYEEAIIEAEASKESYQIKNKLTRLVREKDGHQEEPIFVQLQLTAIEKRSGEAYNSEQWLFQI
jgi:hypothetical protein